MATMTTLDWSDAFKAPTLQEVQEKRFSSPQLVTKSQLKDTFKRVSPYDLEAIKDLLEGESKDSVAFIVDNDTLEHEKVRTFKDSALFILRTASFSVAVVSLGGLALGSALTAFGFGAGEAILAFAPTGVESGDGGWNLFIDKILWIVDKIVEGVIIFSGILWAFGNRSKAIELLLGSGLGYVICTHYKDIKDLRFIIIEKEK